MDLTDSAYTEDELKAFLQNREASQLHILMTQKNLSLDFCLDYILNEKYSLSDRDEYLDINDVIRLQPHLKNKIKFV